MMKKPRISPPFLMLVIGGALCIVVALLSLFLVEPFLLGLLFALAIMLAIGMGTGYAIRERRVFKTNSTIPQFIYTRQVIDVHITQAIFGLTEGLLKALGPHGAHEIIIRSSKLATRITIIVVGHPGAERVNTDGWHVHEINDEEPEVIA